jgi:drug/metabolite transporter (DMT)-like permease
MGEVSLQSVPGFWVEPPGTAFRAPFIDQAGDARQHGRRDFRCGRFERLRRPFLSGSITPMVGPNLALLFTVVAWASNIPASAVLIEHWDPWFVSVLRFGSGYVAIWLLLRSREAGASRTGLPVASWRLWLLGAAGAGLFGPIYNLGIATSNPVMVAILNAALPVVAALVGRFCFKHPIERHMLPAILLAGAGCALATWDPANASDPFSVRGGEPLILVAMFLWCWYSLAAQRWLRGWSQMRITTATLGPGVVIIILLYLAAGLLGFASLSPKPPRGALDIGLLLWIGVGGVTFAMLFWNYGVQRLGLVVASLFLNLVPIVTLLILALMGQMPTWLQLAGTALVVLGLLQAQLRALPARRAA